MPKPKPTPSPGERTLTEAEWNRLTALYWEPYLAEMLALDTRLALKDDKAGGDARQRIYDRLVGKPIEVSKQEVSSTITITVRPITATEDKVGTVEVDKVGERGVGVVEGGGGVCEKAMDRSIIYRNSSPHPPGPPTSVSGGTLNDDPPLNLSASLVSPELPIPIVGMDATVMVPLPPMLAETVPSVGVSPRVDTTVIDADTLPARFQPRR